MGSGYVLSRNIEALERNRDLWKERALKAERELESVKDAFLTVTNVSVEEWLA